MQGPILIARFKSLRILELKKIPTHMLEGLHKFEDNFKLWLLPGVCTTYK